MNLEVPATSFRDERIDIRVQGLRPGETVVVELSADRIPMFGCYTARCAAAATFRANSAGIVELSSQVPESGPYNLADSMGLFWSASVVDIAERATSLEELTEPLRYELYATTDDRRDTSVSFERNVVGNDVCWRSVTSGGVRGTLFLPDAGYRGACVIYLEGSGGGRNVLEPALLASSGTACLSLPYFNFEDLPEQMLRLPVEYVVRAIDWLSAQPEVDAERIGACGISRGAESALLIASLDPRLKAVAAIVPSGIVWPSPSSPGFLEGEALPPWTLRGKPLPFRAVPHRWEQQHKLLDARKAAMKATARGAPFASTPFFEAAMPDDPIHSPAHSAVEKINGDVLLVSAGDDKLWPSSEFVEQIVRRLKSCRFHHVVERLHFEGAGHALCAPYMPSLTEYTNPATGVRTAFGGTDAVNAAAMVDTWRAVRRFFRESL